MSNAHDDHTPIPAPEHDSVPSTKPSWGGRLVVLALVGGLGFVLAGRIRTAMEQQKQTESARKTSAEQAQAKAAAPPAVGVVRGAPDKWLPSIAVDGTLMPARETDLAFKVPGQLGRIDVKAGDWVESGATLAALDSTEAVAQVKAAEAQIRVARAQLFLAEDDAKRMESLASSGATTGVVAGEAKGRAEITAGQLDGAKAQLLLASANLKNHVLTAPFAGFVTRAPTAAGGIVGPAAQLFHLQDVTTLRLVGTVSEQDISLVKLGAKLTFEVTENDGSTKTIDAKVTTVLPSVDPATRRVPFEAEVKNEIVRAPGKPPSVPLRGGVYVRGKLAGDAPLEVLRLPATTLRPGSQDELMLVVGGKLKSRRVSFATAADGSLLVRAGLSRDEDVMLTPVAESKDGDSVTVLPNGTERSDATGDKKSPGKQ